MSENEIKLGAHDRQEFIDHPVNLSDSRKAWSRIDVASEENAIALQEIKSVLREIRPHRQ